MGQHTDLGTKGADVGKAAKGVRSDETGPGGEIGVVSVGLERSVCDKLVLT
jgi:hypothetical protein